MKHTLLLTLSAFLITVFMTACSSKGDVVILDKDECTDINNLRLKRFRNYVRIFARFFCSRGRRKSDF